MRIHPLFPVSPRMDHQSPTFRDANFSYEIGAAFVVSGQGVIDRAALTGYAFATMMKASTHPYGILRLDPEFGSSGIWNPPNPASMVSGPMIDYDLLDLPDELVVRLKAWQKRYEDGFDPGSADPTLHNPPDEFWDSLKAEATKLAHGLYEAVGGRVQYYSGGGLWSVGKNEPDATNEELQADYERRLADMQRKIREEHQP